MLSDIDIKKALESKDIIIEPLDFKDIQPSSVDLRVGYELSNFPKSQVQRILTLKHKQERVKQL